MKDDRPIIYVDVDGVCANLIDTWTTRYNAHYGDDLSQARITSWNMHEWVKPECGNKIYDYLRDKDLYDHVEPIPGALEGVNVLRDRGFRVVFATSSVRGGMGLKLEWLVQHGFLQLNGSYPCYDYVEISSKHLLRGVALIDDYGKNLEHFEGQRFLFDAHHNKITLHDTFVRMTGWIDVPFILRYLKP